MQETSKMVEGVLRIQKGFTLLELLMVVIIIGILAAIALPQYLRVAERSRGAEALQNLAAIRSAQMRLRAQTGAYTTVLTAATTLDIDIPQLAPGPAPGTPRWTFSTTALCPLGTCNIIATRVGSLKVIHADIEAGTSCSDDVQYGLPALPC